MNRSRKTSLVLVSLVVGLLMAFGATLALASPQGDEDPTFNGQGAAFNVMDPESYDMNPFTHPLTTQDPNDKTVIAATALYGDGESIHIARFTTDGKATTFGGDGDVDINTKDSVYDLLDVRVLKSSGDIYVLYRRGDGTLGWVRSSRDGSVLDYSDADTIKPPAGCEQPFVDAARVEPDGNFVSLWNCEEQADNQQAVQAQIVPANTTWVVRNKPAVAPGGGNTQQADKQVTALPYGTDVELDPVNGDVYALGSQETGGSYVVRLTGALTLDPDYGGAANPVRKVSDDDPLDLAVDYSHRPLVWTSGRLQAAVATNPWIIHRLKPGGLLGEGEADPGWGTNGIVTLDDDQLGIPESSDLPMLLARPDNKVMAIGSNTSRESEVIVRMNTNGTVDTSWADHGYKQLEFANGSGDERTIRFGNIALQSDNKTLVAFHSQLYVETDPLSTRRFGDPGDDQVLGVGRLDRAASTPSNPSSPGQGAVLGTSASGGSVCGRRAISLVRADVHGGKIKLSGLVGAAYYGKKVSLYASSGHGYRKLKTVRATKSGRFSARVRRPRGRKFIVTRYIARAGRSKSPVLKLPQSLRSTSIKSKNGKITVKGHVKRALLGKRRNRVKIQRLVCGHYKTVGSARPSRSGRYTVTFKTPRLGGVAYYRARGVVLNKPGGHKYVVQYARAIRIKLTAQTG